MCTLQAGHTRPPRDALCTAIVSTTLGGVSPPCTPRADSSPAMPFATHCLATIAIRRVLGGVHHHARVPQARRACPPCDAIRTHRCPSICRLRLSASLQTVRVSCSRGDVSCRPTAISVVSPGSTLAHQVAKAGPKPLCSTWPPTAPLRMSAHAPARSAATRARHIPDRQPQPPR